jgi:hypothetical protein
VKTIAILAISFLSFNVFACTDNFNGKYVDQNSETNILEIKVSNCSLNFELDFPAESRSGHVTADNIDRVIWNGGGRKVSEKASVGDKTLMVNIVDKHVWDVYYQNQIYTLTPNGLELDIEIYNTKRTYDYKKHISYLRE